MMITEILASVSAPHFTAGAVLWDDKVVEVAPILRYMKGWSRDRVRAYCKDNGWSISVVHELRRHRTYEGLDERAPSGRRSLS